VEYDSIYGNLENIASTFYEVFGGGHIGVRYFFTNNIGMFVEAGYNTITIGTVGLTFKF
jgi:hypothetical protein